MTNNTVPFPRKPQHDTLDDEPTPFPARSGWRRFGAWLAEAAADRLMDVLEAPDDGWRGMATWIKTIVVLAGLAAAGFLVWGLVAAVIVAWTSWEWHSLGTGLIATLHQPVRDFIAAHTTGLPITATTIYGAWQLFGAGSFILSAWARAAGARLTWTAWGAATTAMVWTASPTSGRAVAAALTILAWTAASTIALRGLTLRSTTFVHVYNNVQPTPVSVDAHVHVPEPVVKRVEINGRALQSADD
ncbi:hypothetical protein ACGFYY_32675 [Streptomyces sp. NPDC048331]|uniref:hypothetical protein n=1 Tax=Streptomyces sp. NPDC048331 TaxID=3365534 RepID=UPI00371DBF56